MTIAPMAMALDDGGGRPPVPARLIRAADDVLRNVAVDEVTIALVAEAAGVARSTAFRHFGGRDRMITAVALWRSRSFAHAALLAMDGRHGTFAKLEAAFTYLSGAVADDPIMRELFLLNPAADFGPDALAIAAETFSPTIEAGRHAGSVRSDISSDEAVRWIVEQLYLAILQSDRSPGGATRRFRAFVTPALSSQDGDEVPGAVQSMLETVDAALAQACEAAAELRRALTDAGSEDDPIGIS